jgi:iron(III) transport system substrate-binding protein
VINSFYLALFWANQNTTGVHVNISGAGVTKYAKSSQKNAPTTRVRAKPKKKPPQK